MKLSKPKPTTKEFIDGAELKRSEVKVEKKRINIDVTVDEYEAFQELLFQRRAKMASVLRVCVRRFIDNEMKVDDFIIK